MILCAVWRVFKVKCSLLSDSRRLQSRLFWCKKVPEIVFLLWIKKRRWKQNQREEVQPKQNERFLRWSSDTLSLFSLSRGQNKISAPDAQRLLTQHIEGDLHIHSTFSVSLSISLNSRLLTNKLREGVFWRKCGSIFRTCGLIQLWGGRRLLFGFHFPLVLNVVSDTLKAEQETDQWLQIAFNVWVWRENMTAALPKHLNSVRIFKHFETF